MLSLNILNTFVKMKHTRHNIFNKVIFLFMYLVTRVVVYVCLCDGIKEGNCMCVEASGVRCLSQLLSTSCLFLCSFICSFSWCFQFVCLFAGVRLGFALLLRQDLSLDLFLTDQTTMTVHGAPEILLAPPCQCHDYKIVFLCGYCAHKLRSPSLHNTQF